MLNLILTIITVSACLITVLRVLTYKHDGKCKRTLSLVAAALSLCMFGQAINLIFYSYPASFYDAGMSLLVMVALLKSKGNVSCFFRWSHEHN